MCLRKRISIVIIPLIIFGFIAGNSEYLFCGNESDSQTSKSHNDGATPSKVEIYDNNWKLYPGDNLTITGRVLDSSSNPIADVAMGVEDPLLCQSIPNIDITDSNGEFSYTISTNPYTATKNYSFVFFAAPGDCYCAVTISVAPFGDDYLEILYDFSVEVGVNGTTPFSDAANLINSKLEWSQYLPPMVNTKIIEQSMKFYTAIPDHVNIEELVKDPTAWVAVVGTASCLLPSGITQASTCPVGIKATTDLIAKYLVVDIAHEIIDDLNIDQDEKDNLHLAVDSGYYVWSLATFSTNGSILDSFYEIGSIVMSSYELITDYGQIILSGYDGNYTQTISLWDSRKWSPLKRQTWTYGSSSFPAIAADLNCGIHIIWADDKSGNAEIFHKHLADGGTTWSKPNRITWSPGDSMVPTIGIDSENWIHVAYGDFITSTMDWQVIYRNSSNSGDKWSNPKRITWSSWDSEYPNLAIDSENRIHLVWNERLDVFYKHSTDRGKNWSKPIPIAWNPGGSYAPKIAADSGTGIHVVWQDNSPGNEEIFYKRSTNNGVAWLKPERLTWNEGNSMYPSVAVDSSNRVYVVWQDDSSGFGFDIFYRCSIDGGDTWSTKLKRLTWNAHATLPSIKIDQDKGIHVVWSGGNVGEILYKNSINGGVDWSKPLRLTWNYGESWSPSLVTDLNSGIHVVWMDDTFGSFDIYYRNRK